jgi:hypothetical protein
MSRFVRTFIPRMAAEPDSPAKREQTPSKGGVFTLARQWKWKMPPGACSPLGE